MVSVQRWIAAGLLLPAVLGGLLGCQAQQAVDHYLSFDAVVTDLYDKHVLFNLARRDTGRTMVQMDYRGFSANLNFNTSMSGKVQFFTNPDDEGEDLSVSLYNFRQAFEPNISNSRSSGLGISSGPANHQAAIRVLYDEQVDRPYEQRIFRRTSNMWVAMRSYCWVRAPENGLYYVPQDKRREFADFVHLVSFYEPPQEPGPPAEAMLAPPPVPGEAVVAGPVPGEAVVAGPEPAEPAEPMAGDLSVPETQPTATQPAATRPAGTPVGLPGPAGG